MSQIVPLLDALKKYDAEEIRLEVGDRIYMLQDGQRRDLGREPLQERVYADSCGLKTAFLGNGGRKAATIFSLRYSSSR